MGLSITGNNLPRIPIFFAIMKRFFFSKLFLFLLPFILTSTGHPNPVYSGKRTVTQVVICESHDRALYHWFMASEKGIIPNRGNTVIHFDAHPDLAVPECDISRSWFLNGDKFEECVNIANFQLLAVRAGLVKKIIWLRPVWADQFSDGLHRFHMGEDATGRLYVDNSHDYYVTDEEWAPLSNLKNTTQVQFVVLPLIKAKKMVSLANDPVIVDIDLDGYSTFNPGVEFFRRSGILYAEIKQIKKMFSPDHLWLSQGTKEREKDVIVIKKAVLALIEGPWYSALWAFPKLFRRGITPSDLYRLFTIINRLDPSLRTKDLIENFEYVIGLPEHMATKKEIAQITLDIRHLLESNSMEPALITIARSVKNGFTPKDVWPKIETSLLTMLKETIGDIDIRYDGNVTPVFE